MADLQNLFPNKDQFDTMNLLLASIASKAGGIPIKSWADVQALVRQNLHSKAMAVADQLETERAVSVSASIGGSTGIKTVTVDGDALINALQSNLSGTFVLTYDGNVWLNQIGETVTLQNWGITVTGTPAKDDVIIINITSRVLTFDILDFDKHTPKNANLSHSLPLGLHDVFAYGTIPFCAPQLMYYTEGGLPAGNYKFTLNHATYVDTTQYDGTYMFTLNKAIPADGGFRHTNIGGYKSSYAQGDVIGNYITTYGVRPQRAEVEKNVAVKVWDGSTACTDLGTFTASNPAYHTETDATNGGKRNFTQRQASGSNRWRDCALRMWLNSDAEEVPSTNTTTVSNWWKPATVFDTVPNGAKLSGFLHGLDPAFVAVLGEVEIKTALSNCDKVDGATYDITYDRVWLQSITEIFGTNNNGIDEGSQLAYWVGASNADRIKYEGSTARYWWERSPRPNNAYGINVVNPQGSQQYDYGTHTYGIVPACCIV